MQEAVQGDVARTWLARGSPSDGIGPDRDRPRNASLRDRQTTLPA